MSCLGIPFYIYPRVRAMPAHNYIQSDVLAAGTAVPRGRISVGSAISSLSTHIMADKVTAPQSTSDHRTTSDREDIFPIKDHSLC